MNGLEMSVQWRLGRHWLAGSSLAVSARHLNRTPVRQWFSISRLIIYMKLSIFGITRALVYGEIVRAPAFAPRRRAGHPSAPRSSNRG